jgi:hypothetical protein
MIPQQILETHPALAHLLDDFETASVYCHASLIRPPVLGKVILHQVSDDSHTPADGPEDTRRLLAELSGDAGTQAVIVRQDTHWTCVNGMTYVVLLTTPFTQGVISPSTTEIIISTPLSHPNGSTPAITIDRLAITSSLHQKPFLPSLARSTATRSTRQQRAMLNFSADGFLSASLVVDPARERREAGRKRREGGKGVDELGGLQEEEEDEDDDDDDGFWDDELDEGSDDDDEVLNGRHSASVGSLSESSGSITPRPGSYLSIDDLPDRTHNTDNPDSRPNGVPHAPQNGHHDPPTSQDPEDDTFRGFTFVPFPLRRRPISASTRAFHAAEGKGKAREEVAEVQGVWPDDEAVAWLSLKGLARVGVFVGDWVSVCDSLNKSNMNDVAF